MHDLSGACLGCAKLFNRYPGFHQRLKTWISALQIENPELHISCAGRGRDDQEALFHRGASKAHYGQSAHNYNCAVDIFEQRDGLYTLDREWFKRVIEPNLYPALRWYGAPGARFCELPHVEIANWEVLANNGSVRLVE